MCALDGLKLGVELLLMARIAIGMVFEGCGNKS